ncbi:MAG: hypothetical protein OSA81_13705, partial [Longimicrobiales bacterium]|nr:hypothetical protein [Longimicrobiales bacterium]
MAEYDSVEIYDPGDLRRFDTCRRSHFLARVWMRPMWCSSTPKGQRVKQAVPGLLVPACVGRIGDVLLIGHAEELDVGHGCGRQALVGELVARVADGPGAIGRIQGRRRSFHHGPLGELEVRVTVPGLWVEVQ